MIEIDENDVIKTRAPRKLLRVSFPDGTVLCYKSATVTFVEALRKIGVDKLANVQMDLCHLPMFSRECYPSLKEYMKPLDDGWYVNTQSDTSQKYIQLISIANQLGIQYKVEIGTDFKTSNTKCFNKTKSKDCILVQFKDGSYIGGDSPKDTFIQTLRTIGTDIICSKGIVNQGKDLITRFQKYNFQEQVDDKWITIPRTTKDKVIVIKIISLKLNLGLNVTTLE